MAESAAGSRVAWIDATVGASGDMLLGALVDAGVPLHVMQAAIDLLGLDIELRAEPVIRGGLGATKVHVDAPDQHAHRHLPEILSILSALPDDIESDAAAVFTRLAEAEAAVHRVPIEAVHFHEVGAADAIADVVGVVAGFAHLDLGALHCSQLGLGSGSVGAAHGRLPVPVPAVLELVTGVPSAAGPAPFEALTPTGAALLVTLADEWGAMPPMSIEASGSGAGTRDSDGYANMARIVVGRTAAAVDALVQLDTNVDDLDPRLWPGALQAILDAGAVDVWLTPIVMKKGRPAHTLSALFPTTAADAVRGAVFAHTSTIGVREHEVRRETLDRGFDQIEIDGQQIRVKSAWREGEIVNRSLEWEDVAAAAAALGRSPKDVLGQATALLGGLGERPAATDEQRRVE